MVCYLMESGVVMNADKIYKPNPKPVKDPDYDPLGTKKDQGVKSVKGPIRA
jgi:hypothetical protein